MHRILQLLGVVMVLEGVTGVVNQLTSGPPNILLRLFDHFNRLVADRVAVLDGYEIWANAALGVLGVVVFVLGRMAARRSHA